jgi:hypothetical protein
MAVRNDFAAGEVLAAQDLNDTFSSKRSGNANLLYNGAMQVAQRGTSIAGITSGAFVTDRWNYGFGSFGTWTGSVEQDGPTGSGLLSSTKLLCTTAQSTPASGSTLIFRQLLEGQDLQRIRKGTTAAEQLTFSFWVKSNVTGTYVAELRDANNTRQVSAAYTISASATWERKTITFPADTTGAFANDNARSLDVNFWLGAGSDFTSGTLNTAWAAITNANRAAGLTNLAAATSNYWQVTGVQLEVGPVATAFEFKSFGQELAECQRYYYRLSPGVVNQPFGNGWNNSTTQAVVNSFFPVSMRVRPTALEQSGTANQYQINHGNTAATCSAVPSYNAASQDSAASIFTVASGLTAGDGSGGRTENSNGATAYLAWSAEL